MKRKAETRPVGERRPAAKGIVPQARKVLRAFGCFCSAYLLYVLVVDHTISLRWGVMLATIGLVSIFVHTRARRRYYSPLVFSVFYLLGCLMSLAEVVIHKDEIPRSGFSGIGTFGFSDAEMNRVVLVMGAGMAGIMFAGLLAEWAFSRRRCSDAGAPAREGDPKLLQHWQRILLKFVGIWFILSIALIVLMWHLQIGRLGLLTTVTLPFKLNGTLIYLRNVVVPFGGIFLMGQSLNARAKSLTKLVLWLIIVVGALGSFAALSRGYFVNTVVAGLFFIFLTGARRSWERGLLVRYGVLGGLLLFSVVAIVQSLRDRGYETGDTSIAASYRIVADSGVPDLQRQIQNFAMLLTARVGGVREVLLSVSSGVRDMHSTWAAFIEDDNYSMRLLEAVYGVTTRSDGVVNIGPGFGLMGMLNFSGSYTVIFLGTAALCLLIIVAEELFTRHGARSAACFFAICFCGSVWDGPCLSFLMRDAVMVAFCYLIMMWVFRVQKKAELANPGSGSGKPAPSVRHHELGFADMRLSMVKLRSDTGSCLWEQD